MMSRNRGLSKLSGCCCLLGVEFLKCCMGSILLGIQDNVFCCSFFQMSADQLVAQNVPFWKDQGSAESFLLNKNMPELNLTVLLLLSQIILWGDVPAAPLRDAKESRQKSASFDFFFTSKQTHDFRPIFGPLLRRCSVGRSLERLNFCDYSAADDKICFVLFLFQIAAKIAIKKNLAACQFKFLSQFQHLFKSRTFVVVCCLG